jgi:hypothetical protein
MRRKKHEPAVTEMDFLFIDTAPLLTWPTWTFWHMLAVALAVGTLSGLLFK